MSAVDGVLLVASYVALLWVPGLLLAAVLRAPLRMALAVAPAVTFGLIGASTVVLTELDLRWNAWSASVVLIAALAVAFAWRLAAARLGRGTAVPDDEPPVRAPWWWAGAGVGAAGVLALVVLRAGIGGLDSVNQYWDTVWHANFTRWIAETGTASPLRAGVLLNGEDGGPLFYPSAMHAFGALQVQLLGEVPVRVLNTGQLVLCALLVPIGAAALAWAASARDGLAAAFAAFASVLFSSMPFDQVWRPAYPFALALALSATVVAVLVSPRLAVWTRVPLAALACAGAVSVQPAAVACVGIPVCFWYALRLFRREGRGRVTLSLAAVGVLAGLLLAPQLLAAARMGGMVTGRTYPTPFSEANAAGQVLTFRMGFPGEPGQWVLTGLVLLGVVVALATRLRRDGTWLVLSFVAFGVLAVHTLAWLWSPLRLVAGAFWNDYWRLAAVTALFGAALIGLGLAWAARVVVPSSRPALLPVAAAALVAVTLVATAGGYVRRNVDHLEIGFTPNMVGPDHLAAMGELPALVGEDERVLNDPADGSPWMYAATGVHPVFMNFEVPHPGPRELVLLTRFDEYDTDPEVRRIVADLNLRYVYVGDRTVYPWVHVSPGFDDLTAVSGLTPVVQTPTATVYRIDGTTRP